MNKYLLKIAAARKSSPGSLHELEPGIKYDISKHSIKVDTKTKQEIENKYKTRMGLVGGLEGAVYGGALGVLGGLIGIDNLRNRHFRKTPEGESIAGAIQRQTKVFNRTKYLPHVGGALGAAALGIPAYMLTKHYHKPKEEYENHLAKLEKKHEKTIDKLEGWDDV